MKQDSGRSPALIWLKAALLPVLVVTLFLIGWQLRQSGFLDDVESWIATHTLLGAGLFVLLYTVVGISGLPGLPMTIMSGALFGSVWGIILTSLATTLGAALAFFLSRSLAREAVARWLDGKRGFSTLQRWTEEQGAVVVALTRLFPIFPYSLLNYAFGMTRVRFGIYLFWTWLCMLPGTIVYVVGADVANTWMDEKQIPWKLLFIFILALGLLLSLIPWARKRVRQRQAQDALEAEPEAVSSDTAAPLEDSPAVIPPAGEGSTPPEDPPQ